MMNLVKYEFYKARHSVLTYVIIGICCGLALLFTSRDYIFDPIIPGTPNNITGIFMNEVADVGIAMIIIVGCYVIFSFGNDLKQRCVNFEILSGNSRLKVFCSHYLYTFLFSGSIITVSLVVGCCKYGITNLGIQIVKDWSYYLRTVLLIYLLSFAIISICIIFSVVLKDTAKSTVAAFVFLFISCYIMAALANSGAGGQMSAAYEKTTGLLLVYPAYLWRWGLNPNLSGLQIIFVVFVALIWCAISFCISNYLFCRTELR